MTGGHRSRRHHCAAWPRADRWRIRPCSPSCRSATVAAPIWSRSTGAGADHPGRGQGEPRRLPRRPQVAGVSGLLRSLLLRGREPDFPLALLPPEEGLILADRFGGEIMRAAPPRALGAARRKAHADPLRPRCGGPPADPIGSAAVTTGRRARSVRPASAVAPRTASPRSGGGRSSPGSAAGPVAARGRSAARACTSRRRPAPRDRCAARRSCAVARNPSISDAGNGQGWDERYCTLHDLDTRLLVDLAAHRLLERFARLDEARERRIEAGREARRAARADSARRAPDGDG